MWCRLTALSLAFAASQGCSSAVGTVGYPPGPPPLVTFERFQSLDLKGGDDRAAVFRVVNVSDKPVYFYGGIPAYALAVRDGDCWTNVEVPVCGGVIDGRRRPGNELRAGESREFAIVIGDFAGQCRVRMAFNGERYLDGPHAWVWSEVIDASRARPVGSPPRGQGDSREVIGNYTPKFSTEPRILHALWSWSPELATLPKGSSKQMVDKVLAPHSQRIGRRVLGGRGDSLVYYKLDDYLEVECYFDRGEPS